MRESVEGLLSLGVMPDEDAEYEVILRFQEALEAIARPLTDEEAHALLDVFGPDELFGLSWFLLHLVETAPNPAFTSVPPTSQRWHLELWQRYERSRQDAAGEPEA